MKTKNKAYNLLWGFILVLPLVCVLAYMLTLVLATQKGGEMSSTYLSNLPALFVQAAGNVSTQFHTYLGLNSTLESLVSDFLTTVGFTNVTVLPFFMAWVVEVYCVRFITDIFHWLFSIVRDKF